MLTGAFARDETGVTAEGRITTNFLQNRHLALRSGTARHVGNEFGHESLRHLVKVGRSWLRAHAQPRAKLLDAVIRAGDVCG
jgi:hypothetical protein